MANFLKYAWIALEAIGLVGIVVLGIYSKIRRGKDRDASAPLKLRSIGKKKDLG
jgi:hypothetical protein